MWPPTYHEGSPTGYAGAERRRHSPARGTRIEHNKPERERPPSRTVDAPSGPCRAYRCRRTTAWLPPRTSRSPRGARRASPGARGCQHSRAATCAASSLAARSPPAEQATWQAVESNEFRDRRLPRSPKNGKLPVCRHCLVAETSGRYVLPWRSESGANGGDTLLGASMYFKPESSRTQP